MKTCPTCSASYGNDVGFCPRDGSELRSSTGLEPGTVIRKKYEILSEIGRGGMGVVYRARHLIWNEEKALKVLVAAGAAQQGLKGLMAEALVMRHLQHPHIVRVEDADYTEDDQPFVVMEYVDGQSLRQKLDHGGPLAPDLALQITAQTCSALSAAHEKGIIHRDIKPQNVLLGKNADGSETVKIIDFGIAKVREEAGLGFTGMMTGTTGFFVGTPGYASPEQALGMRGSDLDGRTDLYSLGLVLYEMLAGQLPFAADTQVALLGQRLQVEPMPPDRLRRDLHISPDVSKLVMKALAKDRENRYRSAGEMERAVTAVLDSRQAEREGKERETVALARHVQRERLDPPGPEPKKGATTVPGRWELSQRRRIGYVIAAAALALAGTVFFVARSLTEKTARDVREQKAPVESLSRAIATPGSKTKSGRVTEPATPPGDGGYPRKAASRDKPKKEGQEPGQKRAPATGSKGPVAASSAANKSQARAAEGPSGSKSQSMPAGSAKRTDIKGQTPAVSPAQEVPQQPPAVRATPLDVAAEAWALIRNSQNAEDFEDFARSFPGSDLATTARVRAAQLRRAAAPAIARVNPPQPPELQPSPTMPVERAPEGKAVYDTKCKACHKADGSGMAAMKMRSLGSAEVQAKSDADLVAYIRTLKK